MRQSNLVFLVQSFSKKELKEVRRFLASPFFNLRADLQDLFDCIQKAETPSRETIWAELFPKKKYNDTQMRLLMSYLNRLLERYLVYKENETHKLRNELTLAVAYRRRGLRGQYTRTLRAFEKKLEEQPLRNVRYQQLLRDLSFEKQETRTTENPTDTSAQRQLIETTDAHYLATRLRLLCLEAAQKGVYQSKKNQQTDADILALARRTQWAQQPAIQLYLAAYTVLTTPQDDTLYHTFSALIQAHTEAFAADEMREFYLFAINHCIRRLNEGNSLFGTEVLKLYRTALEHGFLFENGVLSRFTYHNIVAAGLRADELDWVGEFIEKYKSNLERKYRESSFSFNLARLELAQGRFDSVQALLQNANYRDPLLNLAAKTLLMKTYHSLGEFDLLQSHLDAMRNYIHRKDVIGYHRKNYLNIVRYMEKVLALNSADKKAKTQLREQIEKEAVLTERLWFLALL